MDPIYSCNEPPSHRGRRRLRGKRPSVLAGQRLTTAMAGLRKASELFKLSCAYYSCNAPFIPKVPYAHPSSLTSAGVVAALYSNTGPCVHTSTDHNRSSTSTFQTPRLPRPWHATAQLVVRAALAGELNGHVVLSGIPGEWHSSCQRVSELLRAPPLGGKGLASAGQQQGGEVTV